MVDSYLIIFHARLITSANEEAHQTWIDHFKEIVYLYTLYCVLGGSVWDQTTVSVARAGPTAVEYSTDQALAWTWFDFGPASQLQTRPIHRLTL